MADQFLDTEVRHELPLVALRAVQLDLGPTEVQHIWLNEVTPAVGANFYSVAGEWAGWGETWLVSRILHKRRAAGPWGRFAGRLFRVRAADGLLESIQRFMKVLRDADPVNPPRADLLMWLARHCVDFVPTEFKALAPDEQRELFALYPEPFRTAMSPALGVAERPAAWQRVERAMEAAE